MIQIPQGFRLGAANADFRGKHLDRNDLSLVFSTAPATAAGVFTTNLFRAAPVLVSEEHIAACADTGVHGVLFNSGQANACTGEQGRENCLRTLDMVSEALGRAREKVSSESLLPASTGVIGAQMAMDKWASAVPSLVDSLGKVDLEGLARAMMTTDAFPKMAGRELSLRGGTVLLAGVAKGAGMICPNMATMLSLVMCDAKVDPSAWRDMFRRAADATFNRVSVDGDTSTNDSLYGLANGASGVTVAEEEIPVLEAALTEVLGELAYMLVKDGEGATKVMHIHVTGAACDADAEKVARTLELRPDGSLRITDTLNGLKPGARIRWQLCTETAALSSGASLHLQSGGKKLVIRNDCGADWTVTPAEQWMHDFDSPNGTAKIVFFEMPAPGSGRLKMTVEFLPGSIRNRK